MAAKQESLCLKELFEKASDLQENIENSDEPSNSDNVQVRLLLSTAVK